MSWWTYANGNIIIDTYSYKENENTISKFINSLPETSGSEGGCEYYINILEGYNASEYYPEGNSFDYQTQYSISIFGNLRDTHANEIQKEIKNILHRITEKFDIVRCCIHIYDQEESILFLKDPCINKIECFTEIKNQKSYETIQLK